VKQGETRQREAIRGKRKEKRKESKKKKRKYSQRRGMELKREE